MDQWIVLYCGVKLWVVKESKKLANTHKVTGTLKGYDALMNLVLDDVDEVVRGKQLFHKYL